MHMPVNCQPAVALWIGCGAVKGVGIVHKLANQLLIPSRTRGDLPGKAAGSRCIARVHGWLR